MATMRTLDLLPEDVQLEVISYLIKGETMAAFKAIRYSGVSLQRAITLYKRIREEEGF